jgi:hypothetical protein
MIDLVKCKCGEENKNLVWLSASTSCRVTESRTRTMTVNNLKPSQHTQKAGGIYPAQPGSCELWSYIYRGTLFVRGTSQKFVKSDTDTGGLLHRAVEEQN